MTALVKHGDKTSCYLSAGIILSVESNHNVESKTENVESNTEKCGVKHSIFTSSNVLF